MSNVISGYRFEMELCNMLRKNGFWAYRVTPNAAGQQPADIIAARRGYHSLIDCKLISGRGGFRFSRIEDNQRLSMGVFQDKCGEQGWLAIRQQSGCIWMLGMNTVLELERHGKTYLGAAELCQYALPWKEWLEWVARRCE